MLLLNLVAARQSVGGALVVRMEDTDQRRWQEPLVEGTFADLEWLGVEYDEGGLKGGPYAPYTQSMRLGEYFQTAKRLVEVGAAYYCFCPPVASAFPTPRSLASLPTPDPCATRPVEQANQFVRSGRRRVVRLQIPSEPVSFYDEVFGRVSVPARAIDHQVLLKSDGFPTYHLSSVVDDHAMDITLVLRASTWLSSTPKHVLLYEALGWTPPAFAHIAALGAGFDLEIGTLRANGYPAEAVIDFALRLGAFGAGRREPIDLDDAIRGFDLRGLGRSSPRADETLLRSLATRHLRNVPLDRLVRGSRPFIERYPARLDEPDYTARVLEFLRPRLTSYRDVADTFSFFWKRPAATMLQAHRPAAAALKNAIIEVDPYDPPQIRRAMHHLIRAYKLPARETWDAWREVVCGSRSAPDLAAVMHLLGRDETLSRLGG